MLPMRAPSGRGGTLVDGSPAQTSAATASAPHSAMSGRFVPDGELADRANQSEIGYASAD